MAFTMVAHGLAEWAVDQLEGEDWGSETEAMTDAWEWAESEGWTIEPSREGGFWMVENGVKVYACLIRYVVTLAKVAA